MSTPSVPQPFSRVLVPLDGSRPAARAVPYASLLATPGATVVLLRVLRHISPVAALRRDRSSITDSGEQHVDLARQELEKDAAPVRRDDLIVQSMVTIGDPASEILRVVEGEDIDLIVLATHGRGAVGRIAFGSVADRIIRHSPVPVFVFRGEEGFATGAGDDSRKLVRRLVIPLDGSDLSRREIPVAIDLAGRFGIPVHLVTVLDPTEMAEPAVALGAAFSTELYEEMNAEMRANAEADLAAAARQFTERGISADWTVRAGPVADTVVSALLPGDVVILSSHGRGGLRRWLLGSVAERLVREASVPILLLPAPGRAALEQNATTGSTSADLVDLLQQETYRPEDLALLLSLDVNTIRSDIFAGRLPAQLLNHHIIEIRREDALRWLRDKE